MYVSCLTLYSEAWAEIYGLHVRLLYALQHVVSNNLFQRISVHTFACLELGMYDLVTITRHASVILYNRA